jgi:hypothetical protein
LLDIAKWHDESRQEKVYVIVYLAEKKWTSRCLESLVLIQFFASSELKPQKQKVVNEEVNKRTQQKK